MKKAFITGLTGFAGTHLAAHLLDKDFSVSGTYLDKNSISRFENRDKISLHELDLLDEEKTFNVIKSIEPDYVFHLAALASPRDSFNNPKKTFTNNISGQLNVFEAIRKIRAI